PYVTPRSLHDALPISEEGVGVREAEPEPVLLEANQDGVVDNAAVLVRDDNVLALADLARRQVARREELRELGAVLPADLDLPLQDRKSTRLNSSHERI